MPRRTPEAIVELVETHENATRLRRDRMDADYSIWQLNELPENSGNPGEDEGPVIGDGYKHYTSNEPRTYAEKVVSIGAASKVLLRVKANTSAETKDKRNDQNDKERFLIGAIASADERLRDIIQPSVLDQLAWYAPLRGWIAVRSLLRKRKDGSTFVDVQPMDPRNTFWGIGPDGLDWVCFRTKRTTLDIKGIYGKEVEGGGSEDEDNGLEVYDFYDKVHNQVVTKLTTLKTATPHGSPRVPVWIGVVGATPQIYGNGKSTGASSDFGESIYATDRGVYPHHNLLMSVLLELFSRARSPGRKVFSADGNKSLDDDPFKEGSEISLRQGAEEVRPLEQVETTKDAAAFAGFVQGEMQRGSLPHSVFGELQFQLSGFAINSLRQGVATIINPTIKALVSAYEGIANLLADQYITGKFQAIEVAGMDRNREYFSEEITPERVEKAGGRIVVQVLPELPQDEPAKMQMAQIARAPDASGMPLFSDRTIREDILNRQDPDADQRVALEQMADRGSKMAQSLALMTAAVEMDRSDLASVYLAEIQTLMVAVLGQNQPQPPQNGTQPQQPGIPAGVAPSQALGMPQVAPTPQQGPLVPPGQPRPGARDIGIVADELL